MAQLNPLFQFGRPSLLEDRSVGTIRSYALVENVVGFCTVFNSAILHHINIKNCTFKKADFKFADLTNMYFENAKLEGSNFKGDVGISEEMIEHLVR